MKTIPASRDLPPEADDRLIDSLLREHARAGSQADEAFLARLDAALDSAAELPADPTDIADRHAARSAAPSRRIAWSLGLAACIALVAGVVWKVRSPSDGPTDLAMEPADRSATPLNTPLPSELIEGTPKPITDAQGRPLPSLERVPTKAPELYVPAGTTLLSRGKPVTASDSNPIIGSLELITDGEKDAGEGYFVELWEGLQWVQIDLGKRSTIQAVWLWHFHSQRRAYHDVIVQVSDDPQFRNHVTTIFNNDYDDSAGLGRGEDRPYVESRFGKLIDARGTRGRYLRLYSNGNSANEMNHYIEVEVFGVSD
jgi:hypothetical protein